MSEIWKPVNGYEGIYEVSSTGKLKSLVRWRRPKEAILKPCTRKGYLLVSLLKNKHSKTYSLARLVADAFIPNPDQKRCVNHISGVKADNSVSNLEWCSHGENMFHAAKNGLTGGVLHANSILHENAVRYIRKNGILGPNGNIKQLQKKYGVGETTILNVIRRRTWKYVV